ncbi:MAG: hypothetical protein CVV20_05975, partial [Gemmatimonadetes bacterium HGW-Gemmatimonadetes-1]
MLSTDPAVRTAYAADASGLILTPDAVARPSNSAEVVELLQRAAADGTAVTAAGGQSSMTGGSITDRGILLSLRGMDRILDLDPVARTVRVEPGIMVGDLKRRLAAEDSSLLPTPPARRRPPSAGRSPATPRG